MPTVDSLFRLSFAMGITPSALVEKIQKGITFE